jgi:hypothetical protein
MPRADAAPSQAMFFDENRVWPRPEPPRPVPALPGKRERFLSRMLLVYALILLLLPVSANGIADLIRYVIALF